MARNGSQIPDPAKYAVKCEKSSTGKHVPQTFEKKVDGQHIKYKACTACGGTLK